MDPEEAPGWRDMYRDNPYYFSRDFPRIPGLDPIDVPARLRRAAGGADRRAARHYTAWKYLLGHTRESGIRLVHGIHDGGTGSQPGEQAWVEIDGGITFDASTKQFYVSDSFLAAVHAEVNHTYTPDEAARLMLRTDHPGPWSDEERHTADEQGG